MTYEDRCGFEYEDDPPAPRPEVCCCTNQGRPWMLDGVEVVSISPGCRVHQRPMIVTKDRYVTNRQGKHYGKHKVGE